MLVHIFPCAIKLSLLTHIHKFNIDALVFTFINVTFSYANKDLLIKKLVIKKVVLAQQEITAEDYLHKIIKNKKLLRRRVRGKIIWGA